MKHRNSHNNWTKKRGLDRIAEANKTTFIALLRIFLIKDIVTTPFARATRPTAVCCPKSSGFIIQMIVRNACHTLQNLFPIPIYGV